MHYNSVLNLSDFSDPDFAELMRRVFAHLAGAFPRFPEGREIAKAWEITQAMRAFQDFGVLGPDKEVLGVAAGFEHTVFYLTNFVKRVFCTDLYVANGEWQEADAKMLVDPTSFATPGLEWVPDRLVVQHMDALALRYEDNSFDGVFSCGSIEHFGSLENVARSAREMARVLKPGGILSISTEYRIDGPPGLGIPGTIVFTREMIEQHIVAASGLQLVDALESNVSPDTAAAAYPLADAVANGIRPRSIALSHEGFSWTSIALCLRKPA
jgi:SAM-dependent methyltransferase